MIVANHAEAEFYLRHLNYYRLGAYWLPFEIDHGSHTFRPGTRFEDVLNLYILDRQLRLLVLDAIERVEVSVRSVWAYHLTQHFGPHAHLESNLAFKADRWQKNIDKLTE
ncbi:Abi family protein, partial [mine drainage metagenome]